MNRIEGSHHCYYPTCDIGLQCCTPIRGNWGKGTWDLSVLLLQLHVNL